ncbi:MAG: hypothetical protein GY755_19665 [Chloroflexi bacterium]|nr:hypothetical protein [Chloroflexota bacterium]
MPEKDKKNLLEKLNKAHFATRETLEKVDLEMVVFEDSGWRVREIIGHIATWNQETAKSLRAYQAGSAYQIEELDEEETDYNARAVAEQKKRSSEQIIAEWEESYEAFRDAIQGMSLEHFPGDMQFPWDERGDIVTLVGYMTDHIIEHQAEIEKAVQK